MRQRHNTALATTGGGYTRHMSAPLSPGAKWVGAAARGTRPRLPPRPAVGPVRCRQGAEERRRVPAAARLLARKQLRRRAATEGNGKVSCADGTRGEVRGCVHLRRRAEIGGAVGSREEERAGWRLLVVRPAATESERAGAASYSRVRKGAASVGDRSGLGARWCSPSKRRIRFRGWWSRATRSARAHVESACRAWSALRAGPTGRCAVPDTSAISAESNRAYSA